MTTLLLVIIYLAYTGLGLPDSLLGSAWPIMHTQLGADLSYAGIISMIITGGTIVASLLSDLVTKKLGTGRSTAIGLATTAAALFGFSLSGSFWMLILFAIPYGLGAGTLDAAMNNYVALHYKSRHMNWLHCFWGLGASISPYIMGYCLTAGFGWQGGYRSVSLIQLAIAVVLISSFPLWKKLKGGIPEPSERRAPMKFSKIISIRGVKLILPAFFAYCAFETTSILWASSYLNLHRGVAYETAARYASFFPLGITVGRFLSGFVASKVGDRNMIRVSIGIILAGIVMVILPLNAQWVCLVGLIVIGFGCAPVFPSVIHATPDNFGAENSQAIIGLQMAGAYTGSTLMAPLFGLIADNISIGLYPAYILILAIVLLVMTELLNRTVDKAKQPG